MDNFLFSLQTNEFYLSQKKKKKQNHIYKPYFFLKITEAFAYNLKMWAKL